METDFERGVRRSGNVVNLPAPGGAAIAQAIFQVSNFAQQIGTKSFIPKKLLVRNNNGGNCWLALGLGIPGVANMPPVRVLNMVDNIWQEFDLPTQEYFADLTAFADAILVGSLDIMVEVEERG